MSNFSSSETDSDETANRRLGLESALLSGIPIGAGQVGHCDVCGVCLRPNHRVEVLVMIDGTMIDVAATRCLSCSRSELRAETERPCLLAAGTIAASVDGAGHSRLILSGAKIVDRTD